MNEIIDYIQDKIQSAYDDGYKQGFTDGVRKMSPKEKKDFKSLEEVIDAFMKDRLDVNDYVRLYNEFVKEESLKNLETDPVGQREDI